MKHLAPFIEAIRVAPYDSAPRLVYADYLDEIGCTKAANRQRYWCELMKKAIPDERKRQWFPTSNGYYKYLIVSPDGSMKESINSFKLK